MINLIEAFFTFVGGGIVTYIYIYHSLKSMQKERVIKS